MAGGCRLSADYGNNAVTAERACVTSRGIASCEVMLSAVLLSVVDGATPAPAAFVGCSR